MTLATHLYLIYLPLQWVTHALNLMSAAMLCMILVFTTCTSLSFISRYRCFQHTWTCSMRLARRARGYPLPGVGDGAIAGCHGTCPVEGHPEREYLRGGFGSGVELWLGSEPMAFFWHTASLLLWVTWAGGLQSWYAPAFVSLHVLDLLLLPGLSCSSVCSIRPPTAVRLHCALAGISAGLLTLLPCFPGTNLHDTVPRHLREPLLSCPPLRENGSDGERKCRGMFVPAN